MFDDNDSPHREVDNELFAELGKKLFAMLNNEDIDSLSDSLRKLKDVKSDAGKDDSLKVVKLGFGK